MKKIIVLFGVLFLSMEANASNAFYISISSQIARKRNMETVANNAANINSVGYEEDAVVFKNTGAGKAILPNNNFVEVKGLYKTGELGGLKTTNSPLDLAVADNNQYLKIMTPRGARLSLSDSFITNMSGVVVNMKGYPLLSASEDVMEIPQNTSSIAVLSNGSLMADGQEVGQIGVFYVEDRNSLIKEGDGLYKTTTPDVPLDDYTIISGALRTSNVSPTKIITQTMESQRSFSGATSFISDIVDLEKQAVSKILKVQ